MRIISGWAKGRKLCTPPGKTQAIRPTSDRAREALFSILGTHCNGSHVLDLYAGTGALGLEAASRGASRVILIDFHKQSLELISKNIQACKPEQHDCSVTLLRHDLRKGLPKSFHSADKSLNFDLIFLDPPYSQGLCVKTLEYFSNGLYLSENAVVVAEERSSESLPEQCGTLTLTDHRTYGETGFWIYSL